MSTDIIFISVLFNLYCSQMLTDGKYQFENYGIRGKYLGASSTNAETSELIVQSEGYSKLGTIDWNLNHGKEGYLIINDATGEYLGAESGKLTLSTEKPFAWSIELDKENRYTVLNYRENNKLSIKDTRKHSSLGLIDDSESTPDSQWIINKQD
ncbi:hypothetical protein CONCODRAFT_2767 [Conidiobolus coronatus NRRL 28638]|uniref:Ricin B lectin domain-containing protein n=1 Tax=Conidiobolus coronatus (strain ATCC 28846 / CBS 209.66 / NRRL 28638) TaxID=796925 RepID=A0A137PH20_CONC2|nr:hypothetical protein CONCODRAFT_2767 [Conidiobolus coronatus NRRL 28638]|eukprot:KXN74231.1 hypothetical protein CONCODRAFT_2767 [Conidiobolus coronatus NRRL 28638]